jgi:BMFP domain-containing protein YqiC
MSDRLKELEERMETLENRTNKLEIKYEAHTAASGDR